MKLHWDNIKNDLHKTISDMFASGRLPKGINHMFLSLIPKLIDQQTSPNIGLSLVAIYTTRFLVKFYAID